MIINQTESIIGVIVIVFTAIFYYYSSATPKKQLQVEKVVTNTESKKVDKDIKKSPVVGQKKSVERNLIRGKKKSTL